MPASPERALAARSDLALEHLLCALSGRAARLQWQPEGATAHPVLRPDALLLPAAMPAGERSLAAVVHAVAHLRHSPAGRPAGRRKRLGLAVASVIEDARAELLLLRQCPGLRALLCRQARATLAEGLGPENGCAMLLARLHLALIDPDCGDAGYWVRKGCRLFAERAEDLARAEAFDDMAAMLANDLGQMRVRLNAREEGVPCAYGDDHSYLWAHAGEAEDDALMLHRPPSGASRRDAPPTAAEAVSAWDLPAVCFDYPEWNHRAGLRRRDWCTVHERCLPPSPGVAFAPPLRAPRPRAFDRGQRLRRQWEGEEIDLDAAIEDAIQRRLGRVAESGLYLRCGRHQPPRSLLLLLDLSASALDPVPGGRVLDLVCAAVARCVAAGVRQGVRVAVHGFSSDGRAQVDYLRFAGFGCRDGDGAAARIAAAGARHSTRLGTALRHAACCLHEERRTRRQVLVLGDAQPSDIDVHEPAYLFADAREAVREARSSGVEAWCLAFGGDPALPPPASIFGRRWTQSVADPAALPRALPALMRRMERE